MGLFNRSPWTDADVARIRDHAYDVYFRRQNEDAAAARTQREQAALIESLQKENAALKEKLRQYGLSL